MRELSNRDKQKEHGAQSDQGAEGQKTGEEKPLRPIYEGGEEGSTPHRRENPKQPNEPRT